MSQTGSQSGRSSIMDSVLQEAPDNNPDYTRSRHYCLGSVCEPLGSLNFSHTGMTASKEAQAVII